MNNPKIIGIIVAWACELWVGPTIKQALANCDEVFVCIEPHAAIMQQFEDSTLEIAQKYKDQVSFIKLKKGMEFSNHFNAKATILNTALKSSKFFEVGNWIFILDVDEFYNEGCFQMLKNSVLNRNIDIVNFKSKYFYIDTKHYLIGEDTRLFRITNTETDHFVPTQVWSKRDATGIVMPIEVGMFHYSALLNLNAKEAFWRSEYPGKTQDNKVTWLNEIYRNYDLNSEETWITKNEELFGIRSPWFSDSLKPDKDGKLFRYDGQHPTVIEEVGLTKINDFRKLYPKI